MNKVQTSIKKETLHIAIGTTLLSIIMNVIFLIVGRWSLTVLFGSILGTVGAILNFFLLGLSIQHAVKQTDKNVKNIVRLSYMLRMFLMIGIMLIGFLVPVFNALAVILPFAFPQIVIYVMRLFGYGKTKKGDYTS